MKSIILVAPPAAGKGTQSSLICEKYGLLHISTGDLIREAIAKNDEMSDYLKSQIESGKLVSDEIILKLLGSRLNEIQKGPGYILDGFPRNVNQAIQYDSMLKEMNEKVSCVIYLAISKELAEKRIVGRISCPKCGRVYNEFIAENQPKIENTCDECGIELTKRSDDNAETFGVRFQTYLDETAPLIDYYKKQNILYEVDSTLPTDQVFAQIESIVDQI